MKLVIQTILVLLSAAALAQSQATSLQEECKELGFISEALACADCEGLFEYVKDEQLASDCRRCCTIKEEVAKYKSATLEVCPNRLVALQEIQKFIDTKASDFANLKLNMAFNAYPKLKLKREDGSKETLRIDNWKSAQIVDFLQDRLLGAKAA